MSRRPSGPESGSVLGVARVRTTRSVRPSNRSGGAMPTVKAGVAACVPISVSDTAPGGRAWRGGLRGVVGLGDQGAEIGLLRTDLDHLIGGTPPVRGALVRGATTGGAPVGDVPSRVCRSVTGSSSPIRSATETRWVPISSGVSGAGPSRSSGP